MARMSANDATGYNLRGIEYSSKAGDTYWRKGDRDGAMPDYDRAIADYDQVIKLAPNYAVAYDNDRLGGRAYYDLIKSGIAGIGLDASKYGSHSMRLGWISTAARNGASVW